MTGWVRDTSSKSNLAERSHQEIVCSQSLTLFVSRNLFVKEECSLKQNIAKIFRRICLALSAVFTVITFEGCKTNWKIGARLILGIHHMGMFGLTAGPTW